MGQARTNRRRAKQAAQKFNHLAPRQRPNYKQRSAEASVRHEAELRATAERIRMGTKKG